MLELEWFWSLYLARSQLECELGYSYLEWNRIELEFYVEFHNSIPIPHWASSSLYGIKVLKAVTVMLYCNVFRLTWMTQLPWIRSWYSYWYQGLLFTLSLLCSWTSWQWLVGGDRYKTQGFVITTSFSFIQNIYINTERNAFVAVSRPQVCDQPAEMEEHSTDVERVEAIA